MEKNINYKREMIPRGWFLTKIENAEQFEWYEYQEIGGEYILKRVISGKKGDDVDKMTFIDYCFAGQNSRVNYRYGVKVEKARMPRVVYTFSNNSTASYSWLTDDTGNPYAYIYNGKSYVIDEVFILDWTFGMAGEWQLIKVTPFAADVSLLIKRWWDGTNVIRDVAVTSGTSSQSTEYDYWPYNPMFSPQWDTYDSWESDDVPQALIGREESLVDIDGDHLLDVAKKSNGSNLLHIWYNRFNRNDDNKIDFEYHCDTLQDERSLNSEDGLFDWNKDGLADRLIRVYSGQTEKLYILKGYIKESYVEFNQMDQSYFYEWEDIYKEATFAEENIIRMPIDMDGDCNADRVSVDINTNQLKVSHSNTKFSDTTEYINYGGGFLRHYTIDQTIFDDIIVDLMDFNGDGLPDRAIKNKDILAVRYNKGGLFTDAIHCYTDPDIENLIERNSERTVGEFDYLDINGDGLLDRVRKKMNEPLRVWFNTGTGFSRDAFTMTGPSDDVMG